MKKTYYGVFRRVNSEIDGEIIEVLKDPDFCNDFETPFDTFITNEDTFLPWETRYRETAIAQADLLTQRDGIRYFIWGHGFDYMQLLKELQ